MHINDLLDKNVVLDLKAAGFVRETLHPTEPLATGLSERRVWEMMVAGETLQSIQEPLPDEFHDWVRDVYMRIKNYAIDKADKIRQTHLRIMDETFWEEADFRENKKRYALAVKDDPDSAYYFLLFNGRGAELEATIIKKELQPSPFLTPANAPKED